MNSITVNLLNLISGFKGAFNGAFNIRENGGCAGRQSTDHIKIESKPDGPGLIIRVLPEAQGETVYIPACVTHSGVDDLVYNDFYVGAGADVTIVAGCGVHVEGEEEARHNGIHRFFLEKGAHVRYEEKHVGTGAGKVCAVSILSRMPHWMRMPYWRWILCRLAASTQRCAKPTPSWPPVPAL